MVAQGSYTARFVDAVLSSVGGYSDSAEADCRACLLDYTGVAVAGAHQLGDKLARYTAQCAGMGSSPVVGLGVKADPFTAALLNGLSAHYLELDDGHRIGMLHPSVPVFSALIAIAEREQLSDEGFFMGVLAGYEATVRLACAVQPDHKLRGFHASATCGTVGAAAAVAVARQYDRQTLIDAVSAAATSASGLLEMITGDSQLKPYNCAQAAVNGLMAANVALAGFQGPSDALGGSRGFVRALNGELDERRFDEALAMPDCLGTIYRKAYASCRHTHSPVEAALRLRERGDIDGTTIEAVAVRTYELAVFGHNESVVASASAAKMSTPYSVAVALLYGEAGLEAYSECRLKDPAVAELAAKVSVVPDDELTRLCPGKRVAELRVSLVDGRSVCERVDYPKGEPENPLTRSELEGKFEGLVRSAGWDAGKASAAIRLIMESPQVLPGYYRLIQGLEV